MEQKNNKIEYRKDRSLTIAKVGRKILSFGRRWAASILVVLYLMSGIVPSSFLLGSIAAFFGGKPKIAYFYPSDVRGEWENLQNIKGSPEVDFIDDLESFSDANSATYKTGSLNLVSESFTNSTDLSSHIFFSAKIKMSFAIGEKEPDFLLEPQENTTSSNELISLWKKVKKIFKFLAVRINKIAKNTILVVRAEEDINTDQEVGEEILATEPLSVEEVVETSQVSGNEESGNEEGLEIEQSLPSTENDSGQEEIPVLDVSVISTEENPPAGEEKDPPTGGLPSGGEEVEENDSFTTTTEIVNEEDEATSTKQIIGEAESVDEIIIEPIVGESTTTEESLPSDGEDVEADSLATSTESLIDSETETSDSTSSDTGGDTSLDENILPNLDAKIIIWWSLDGKDWQILDTISEYPLSNLLNGGYFEYEAPFLQDWDDIENLKIKFEGVIGGETNIVFYLDSIWVEAEYEVQPEPEEEITEEETTKDSGGGGGGGGGGDEGEILDQGNQPDETAEDEGEDTKEEQSPDDVEDEPKTDEEESEEVRDTEEIKEDESVNNEDETEQIEEEVIEEEAEEDAQEEDAQEEDAQEEEVIEEEELEKEITEMFSTGTDIKLIPSKIFRLVSKDAEIYEKIKSYFNAERLSFLKGLDPDQTININLCGDYTEEGEEKFVCEDDWDWNWMETEKGLSAKTKTHQAGLDYLFGDGQLEIKLSFTCGSVAVEDLIYKFIIRVPESVSFDQETFTLLIGDQELIIGFDPEIFEGVVVHEQEGEKIIEFSFYEGTVNPEEYSEISVNLSW